MAACSSCVYWERRWCYSEVAEKLSDVTPERAAALKALGADSRQDAQRSCEGLEGAIGALEDAGPRN